MAPEHVEGQLEPETVSSLIQQTPLAALSTDLVVVSEPVRQELTADYIFLTTVFAKTPFPLIALIVVTPATPELSTMVVPQQSSPSAIAPPSLKVDFKDEFIEELIEGFYKSLKRCFFIIFKSTHTSFAS